MSERYVTNKTEDGTITLYDSVFKESMHTNVSAYDESYIKHINPARILLKNNEPVCVLDVGFGLGYNVLSLLHQRSILIQKNHLTVVSLEYEKIHLPLMKEIQFNDERDELYSKCISLFEHNTYEEENLLMIMKFGDARTSIQEFNSNKFDAIFQDPFSPGKNPELWSLHYFKKIAEMAKSDAVLTTYSSAPQIRKALHEAGFFIGKGPGMGIKKEGTVASLESFEGAFNKEELDEVFHSARSTPYRDPELNLDREKILHNRLEEMKKLREGRPAL